MTLMLLKTPHCAVFLMGIVVGNAAAKTSSFFGAIRKEMTFHTNPEENSLGTLLAKREKQSFQTYKYIYIYMCRNITS